MGRGLSKHLLVKHLSLNLETRELVATSDNSEYEKMRFKLDNDQSDVTIHGKVVLVAGPARAFSSKKQG